MTYLLLIVWVAGIAIVYFARDWLQKEKGWLTGSGSFSLAFAITSYTIVPLFPVAVIDPSSTVSQWAGAVVSVFFTLWLFLALFSATGDGATTSKGKGNFVRGGQRVRAEAHKKLERHMKNEQKKTGRRPTTIGKIVINEDEELLNMFFAGSPGSGKSQAFFEVLEAVRIRRERGIIFDESGDFIRRFYQDGDLIFNPYDQRSVGWSIMNEIRTPKDCATIAQALIPEGGSNDSKEWVGYCRAILTVILRRMLERKETSNRTLYEWVMIRSIGELKTLCQGTPAQRAFEEGSERMTASVMTMLALAVAPWQDVGDGGFSIRDFVQNDDRGDKRFLYLVADANSIKQTAPVYLTMLNLSAVYLNTMEEDQKRRLWFALDELPALEQPLNELSALLNRARKRGGITIIGMQSIKYFNRIYGRDAAETLMAGIGTLLVLRTNSESGAKELAAELGAADFLREQHSVNRNDSGSGKSTSYQHVQDYKLVAPTEVVNLGQRRGFLKLPGDNPVFEVEIPISPILPQEGVKYFVEKSYSMERQEKPETEPPRDAETKERLAPMPPMARDDVKVLAGAAAAGLSGAAFAASVAPDVNEGGDHEMRHHDLTFEKAEPLDIEPNREIQLGADPAHELDGFNADEHNLDG